MIKFRVQSRYCKSYTVMLALLEYCGIKYTLDHADETKIYVSMSPTDNPETRTLNGRTRWIFKDFYDLALQKMFSMYQGRFPKNTLVDLLSDDDLKNRYRQTTYTRVRR